MAPRSTLRRASFRRLASGLVALALLACPAAAQTASPDDTAHILAGLTVPDSSPLAALEGQPGWKQHAAYFDGAFRRVDKLQLSRAARWSDANIKVNRPTLFYLFSGPDFLYANAFFPYANTYVLAGLEPPGTIPDLIKLPRGAMPRALRSLEVSMRAILGFSFFRTIDMKSDFRVNPVPGTIPVIYVFMVRSGKVIHDVSLVQLDEAGNIVTEAKASDPKTSETKPSDPKSPDLTTGTIRPTATGAKGVRITFATPGAPEQTLYYFSADVAGNGFAKSGLKGFCDRFGEGVSLIKSASYLLHQNGFAPVRTFLLSHSAALLQDDTGIPVSFFDASWDLKPFGRYVGPISLFAGSYQPKLTQLFHREPPGRLDFGIGYNYQGNTSNLMLAIKKQPEAATIAPKAKPCAKDKEPAAAC